MNTNHHVIDDIDDIRARSNRQLCYKWLINANNKKYWGVGTNVPRPQ